MQFINTDFEEVLVIEPNILYDHRGFFFESFNKKTISNIFYNEINFDVLQENIVLSDINVIRGLHYQEPPFEQGKLIKVLNGSILDVIVDVRKNSKNYLKYISIELDNYKKKIIWIPPGFAHGYQATSNNTIVSYMVTHNYYNPDYEKSIKWNDPLLNIKWHESSAELIKLSIKDENASNITLE